MEWRKARREGKKGSARKMREEENWTEKRRKFKSEWAGQLHDNTLTCSCTAIGLSSVVQLLRTAPVWLLSGVQRIRGVYSTVPWAKWKIYCQNHTCCHSTYTGPSVCLILLWAQRQRERCVWGGISLPPLIPSLGHPSLLLLMFYTQWLRLHIERDVEKHMHPRPYILLHSRSRILSNLLETFPLFLPCRVHIHMGYMQPLLNIYFLCFLLWKHGEGCCSCVSGCGIA